MSASEGLSLTLPMHRWTRKLSLALGLLAPWSALAFELIRRGAIDHATIAQVIAWGPGLAILIGLALLVERWAPRILETQKKTAVAQEKLANSVTELVERGDRDSRETIGMLKYTLSTLERVDATLDDVRTLAQSTASAVEELRRK